MRAFVRFIGYDMAHGKTHIKHVMRIRTQRKELEGHQVKVIGEDPSKLLEEGFGVVKTGKAGRPITKPLKEFVVSELTESQAKKVKEYLEMRFDRTVYGVYHTDESKPHVHFMMKGLEEGKSKAIRLTKGDLEKIYRDIGKMLGQGLTPYGQGRPRIPLKVYQVDPEHSKQRIKEMIKQDKTILSQVEQIISCYGAIDIYALSDKGKFKVAENVDHVDKVPLKRLKGINLRGEGICFCPIGQEIPSIFIDDISREKGEELLKDYQGMLIETSSNKYQVHLRLQKPLNERDIAIVQKVLTARLEGDRASTDTYHLRRLPGFSNHKYEQRPWVKVVKYNFERKQKKINGQEIVQEYRADKTKQLEGLHNIELLASRKGKKELERLEAILTYNKFIEGWDADLSVADFRFTMHLLSKGFNDHAIKEALKVASPDIMTRKKGHLEDYLDRTLANAKERLGLRRNIER